jgi:predicted MFS family arabinose efflux permease
MVITSTVIGGLLVEAGQEGGATGRMASLRYAMDGVIGVITGPLGGWLAARAFGLTAGIGACLLFSMVPITLIFLKEPPVAKRNMQVWRNAAWQLWDILHSGTMWAAAVLLFFVFIAPGFGTALTYYQTDVLHFKPEFIGILQALGGIGGLLATGLYAIYCRKLTLKPLLLMGILLNALSSLLYLAYHSSSQAIFIDFSNGFLGVLGVLPLFDLAARATPKGSESFGYALLMSVYNLAIFAVSNPLGSRLYELADPFWHHNLMRLVWLNTGTSLIALVLVPFLPRVLLSKREGEPM